jgi:hypothetical protein
MRAVAEGGGNSHVDTELVAPAQPPWLCIRSLGAQAVWSPVSRRAYDCITAP